MGNETDKFYYELCLKVASGSKCHSKQIGAILVHDDIVLCTGINGPAKGIPACSNRLTLDPILKEVILKSGINEERIKHAIRVKMCPRDLFGFSRNEGLEYCNAIHAELNCLLSATRFGIPTKGSTLYISNDESPCSQCFSACIQAGIKEIVLLKNNPVDPTIQWCIKHSDIIIREFDL